MITWGLWSNEICCWVRLCDLTGSSIEPPLRSAAPTWGEQEAAEASIPIVAGLSGFNPALLFVRPMTGADDWWECHCGHWNSSMRGACGRSKCNGIKANQLV